jgi:uncharacterized lipoprotein
MTIVRLMICLAAAGLVSGCHTISHWLAADCHAPQEYQHAVQTPPLRVSAGLDSPNTQSALVIPTVELAPPPPGAKDACLDAPPRYKAAPPNKAAGG